MVRSQVKALLGEATLEAYAEAFLKAHGSSSLAHRAAAAEVRALLQPGHKQQAVALLLEGSGPLGKICRAPILAPFWLYVYVCFSRSKTMRDCFKDC